MLRPIPLGIAVLLGFAGCAKSDAAAPPAPKAVAAPPIIPSATPIRTPVVAASNVEIEDSALEMPAEIVERRVAQTEEPAAAPAPKPYREPILSDGLGLLDDVGSAPEPEPATTPAPSTAPAPAVDDSDVALMEATTKGPAPTEMVGRSEPVVHSKPSSAPRAPAKPVAPTKLEATKPSAPSSTVSVGPTTSISNSSLSPTDVRKTIQRSYLGGVRTCHGDAPDQSGSVTVQITVGPDGRVDIARAMGFSSAVDACLKAAARGWRFDIPRDGAGQPTTAPYKIEFRLTRS